jgi:peptidyl-tRNA hydrolase, PTH1 family
MKAIFGLGNPGANYKNNRHNAGFMLLDALAKVKKAGFKRNAGLAGYIACADVDSQETLFVKPDTFMNNSGLCVKKVLSRYKITPQDILVVYDDVELPLGTLRFRDKGGYAGHRGMESIAIELGTKDFNRLRLGIDKPAGVIDLAQYVLADFNRHEKEVLSDVIEKATSGCLDWIGSGSAYVMNKYNNR